MQSLHELGLKYGTDKATHHGFCEFYEANIDKSNIDSVLEIGVRTGNSLEMWREWLPSASILGIDIADPGRLIPNVSFMQADATKDSILNYLPLADFCLIIDDGSHFTLDQIKTFSLLWPKCGYAYIIEDIHTSFLPEYFSGRHAVTAYDYFKDFAVKNNLRLIEFWRNPEDKTDSGTLILFK